MATRSMSVGAEHRVDRRRPARSRTGAGPRGRTCRWRWPRPPARSPPTRGRGSACPGRSCPRRSPRRASAARGARRDAGDGPSAGGESASSGVGSYSMTIASGDCSSVARRSYAASASSMPIRSVISGAASTRPADDQLEEGGRCCGARSSGRSRSGSRGRAPRTPCRTARARRSATSAGRAPCRSRWSAGAPSPRRPTITTRGAVAAQPRRELHGVGGARGGRDHHRVALARGRGHARRLPAGRA